MLNVITRTDFCAVIYRCNKAECGATKANQQQGELKLSRRALQSELLAALLIAAHAGWLPEKAMAESQQSTDSADQELDLTITDKVCCDQGKEQQRHSPSAAHMPAGIPGGWLMP